MIRIVRADCAFENEPFSAPFGFKGGYLTESDGNSFLKSMVRAQARFRDR